MNAQETVSRCSAAAEEFDHHEQRSDGLQVIESLCGGLTLIRDAVYARVHADVERRLGTDSMIFPLSEEKSERVTKVEIEIYQIVVAAGAAQAKGYVADGNWFRDWLARLRMGQLDSNSRAARRISYYVSKSAHDQRLAFGNILAMAQPEASRAPLVLLRLGPGGRADCHRAGLWKVGRCPAVAARADRGPALDSGLPSLSRQASGKRRAVCSVRQPALDLRLADQRRRLNTLNFVYRPWPALLPDLYRATMAYGYWKAGPSDRETPCRLRPTP